MKFVYGHGTTCTALRRQSSAFWAWMGLGTPYTMSLVVLEN